MKPGPIAAIALFLLAGCASQKQIARMSNNELCSNYHEYKSDLAKAELVRRAALTESEWALVAEKKIRVGISETALICSWGTPSGWGDIHTRTSASGTTKQYVYRVCRSCSANYVYVRGGAVSSFSN